MNTDTDTIRWSDDYEVICDSIRQNSIIMGNFHKNRYLYHKYILQFFRIPVIILSGLNSVFSVGLQPFVQQGTISIITCAISFMCGMIGSVELYLQIQNQMENELSMSKEFYMLAIEIYKCLSLNRENRTFDGKTFLEEKFNIYEKLIENSGVITKQIADKMTPLPKSQSKNLIKKISKQILSTETSSAALSLHTLFPVSDTFQGYKNESLKIVEDINSDLSQESEPVLDDNANV